MGSDRGMSKCVCLRPPQRSAVASHARYPRGMRTPFRDRASSCFMLLIEAATLASAKVQGYAAGKSIKKVIVVPGKLVNVVVA